jgi:hypothetical protein
LKIDFPAMLPFNAIIAEPGTKACENGKKDVFQGKKMRLKHLSIGNIYTTISLFSMTFGAAVVETIAIPAFLKSLLHLSDWHKFWAAKPFRVRHYDRSALMTVRILSEHGLAPLVRIDLVQMFKAVFRYFVQRSGGIFLAIHQPKIWSEMINHPNHNLTPISLVYSQ